MSIRHRASGFSLIELLVVISVIGIITSMVLMSLGVLRDDRQLRVEARRISSLIELAQDEAVMQGREFGLEVMVSSYRFVEYDPFQLRWVEIIGDDMFRFRQLPADIEFDLLLEDQIIVLDMDPEQIEDPDSNDIGRSTETYAPHVMIFSSGDSTPFELQIVNRSEQQKVIMRGDLTGAIEVMTETE
jgi:general secretion pathway protein H